ncbi:MAG: IPTL-CTERM sorting domain-containing protein [Myxococcales bacterium]|nr:IPTL-CTERM sorting domain-containing protein [Myxococcales bacterium]
MNRIPVALLLLAAFFTLARPALAQQPGGSRHGDVRAAALAPGCVCEQPVQGPPTCTNQDVPCSRRRCLTNQDCFSDEICENGANNICPNGDTCLPTSGTCNATGTAPAQAGVCSMDHTTCFKYGDCSPLVVQCTGGACASASTVGAVVACTNAPVPSLPQWGLIALGVLLSSAGVVVLRRPGRFGVLRAALLLLVCASLVGAGHAYMRIQRDRVCGERDAAVDLIQRLLNG